MEQQSKEKQKGGLDMTPNPPCKLNAYFW